jgi:uncharacterized protein YbjQ (UPF0145 family)
MLLTTTSSIDNTPIKQYKGVVTGEVIIGANFLKDIFASVRDFIGGRSSAYEGVLNEARQNAMREMMQNAQAMGANAIIGIDIDYETLGMKGSMIMVNVSGTAVVI